MNAEIPYEIRFIDKDEWEETMGMVWKVFLEFEGNVYSPKGVASFEDFITSSALKRMFDLGVYQVMGAYDKGKLVGMISLRNESHISLLFVDSRYHKRGIGRALGLALAAYARTEMGQEKFTVNASPYGVEFYHRLGFWDAGIQREQDGIIFTPMVLNIKGNE